MAVTLEQITDNYLHVGWLVNEVNPKTRKFQRGQESGQVIFDPVMVAHQLDHAKAKVQAARQAKKDILVVCLKTIYAAEVEALAKQHKFHYMTYKLPAGFLTNFDTLIKRIEAMNEQRKFVASEHFTKMTKKEQSMSKRSLAKVEKVYAGVKDLRTRPELVLVVDGRLMQDFATEIKQTKVDNVVLTASNFNQRRADGDLVTMNMQSHKALDFAMKYILS